MYAGCIDDVVDCYYTTITINNNTTLFNILFFNYSNKNTITNTNTNSNKNNNNNNNNNNNKYYSIIVIE